VHIQAVPASTPSSSPAVGAYRELSGAVEINTRDIRRLSNVAGTFRNFQAWMLAAGALPAGGQHPIGRRDARLRTAAVPQAA
jgi:hypothetical protein